MEIEVFYMSGAGNTFSVLDNRKLKLSVRKAAKLAPLLCTKNEANKYSTEGLMMLGEAEPGTDFSVEFFNPDGSHGAMCGNGGRCALMLAKHLGFIDGGKQQYTFSMASNIYSAEFRDPDIRLYLPPPFAVRSPLKLILPGMALDYGYVDVNSDHVVINKNSVPALSSIPLREIDMAEFALPIRHHQDFMPSGTNVNLYEVDSDNTIQLRTFERGVEAETGACGTGSVSTALISKLNGEAGFPVRIIPPSGIALRVDTVTDRNGNIINTVLEGPAVIIDRSEIDIAPDIL